MTSYPIELPGAPLSGLSSDQMQALFAGPLAGQVQKSLRLGANMPVNHMNAVGLWYWGTTPFGDWSGTTQQINEDGDMGSGGPADCPYSTAGAHTVVGAGMVRERTGSFSSSLTSLGLEKPLAANLSTDPLYAGAAFTLAARKMTEKVIGQNASGLVAADVTNDPVITGCDWDAAAGTITLTGGKTLAGTYTFTGDDWCIVRGVAPVGTVKGRPGWYPIDAFNGTTQITLGADSIGVVHASNVAAGVDILIVQSAQARALTAGTYIDTVSISGTSGRTDSFVSNNDTLTVNGRVYTFKTTLTGAADEIAIPAPTDDSGGWTAAQRNTFLRAIADALRLNTQVEVLEASDAITSLFSFRAATRTQFQVTMSLATGLGIALGGYESAPGFFECSRGKLSTITGGVPVVSTDDVVRFVQVASVGVVWKPWEQRYARVDAGDGAAVLWVHDDDLLTLDSGEEIVKAVQYLRYPFVQRDVVLDATAGANDSPVVAAGSPKTFSLEAQVAVNDTLTITGGTNGNVDRVSRTWTFVAVATLSTHIAIGATVADTCTNIAARINAQFGAYLVAVGGATTVQITKGGSAFADSTYTISKSSKSIDLGNGTALNTLRYASQLSTAGWTDPRFKRGDLYLVWAKTPLPVGFPVQVQSTNPEAVPTLSARNTEACMWPYGTPNRAERAAYPGTYPNVFAAPEDSQMNSAWIGTFRLPRELFLHGDKVALSMVADLQAFGTPMLIEVLVIPDFDPEQDWLRGGEIPNGQRLLEANGKAMWFQSPTIIDVDRNAGCQITLQGQAGSVQTIGLQETGDNYSQQWTCTFDLYGNDTEQPFSGTGGGANSQARGFPRTIGPAAHITTPDVEDFAKIDYAFTVLVAAVHPAQKNMPGYHGHHAGEPYSTRSGNGGVRFTFRGQGSNVEADSRGQNQIVPLLPYGGSFRVAAFNVVHTPGGSY